MFDHWREHLYLGVGEKAKWVRRPTYRLLGLAGFYVP